MTGSSRSNVAIRNFVEMWQVELSRLIKEAGTSILPLSSGLIVGRAILFPCNDAVVVLVYSTADGALSVELRLPTRMSVAEFTSKHQAMRFYDQFHHWEPGYPSVSIRNDLTYEIRRIGGGISLENWSKRPGLAFHQRFSNVIGIGLKADLTDPHLAALEHFQRETFARNLGVGGQVDDGSRRRAYRSLLQRFRDLLDSAGKEEEVQTFLRDNPILLCPTYIRVIPKYKLGKDYVTDFVFESQTGRGIEWIFVEIERPDKALFTQSGQQHNQFSQAQDQLLCWELWLERNQSYAQEDLAGLRNPVMQLVYGRDAALKVGQREKLRALEKPSHIYSTYDDLAHRFEVLVERLFE